MNTLYDLVIDRAALYTIQKTTHTHAFCHSISNASPHSHFFNSTVISPNVIWDPMAILRYFYNT